MQILAPRADVDGEGFAASVGRNLQLRGPVGCMRVQMPTSAATRPRIAARTSSALPERRVRAGGGGLGRGLATMRAIVGCAPAVESSALSQVNRARVRRVCSFRRMSWWRHTHTAPVRPDCTRVHTHTHTSAQPVCRDRGDRRLPFSQRGARSPAGCSVRAPSSRSAIRRQSGARRRGYRRRARWRLPACASTGRPHCGDAAVDHPACGAQELERLATVAATEPLVVLHNPCGRTPAITSARPCRRR